MIDEFEKLKLRRCEVYPDRESPIHRRADDRSLKDVSDARLLAVHFDISDVMSYST